MLPTGGALSSGNSEICDLFEFELWPDLCLMRVVILPESERPLIEHNSQSEDIADWQKTSQSGQSENQVKTRMFSHRFSIICYAVLPFKDNNLKNTDTN